MVESFSNLSMLANDPQARSVGSVINDPRTGSQTHSAHRHLERARRPARAQSRSPRQGCRRLRTCWRAAPTAPCSMPGDARVPHGAQRQLAPAAEACTCSTRSPSSTCSACRARTDPATISEAAEATVAISAPSTSSTAPGRHFRLTADRSRSASRATTAINSAFYFPWVNAPDPLQQGRLRPFPPCGFVAGIYAATDATPRRVEGARRHRRQPHGRGGPDHGADRPAERHSEHPGHQLPAQLPGLRRRRLGRAHAARQRPGRARSGSTFRSAAWRSSSNPACTTARSGWSSSRTTSRCGARSG